MVVLAFNDLRLCQTSVIKYFAKIVPSEWPPLFQCQSIPTTLGEHMVRKIIFFEEYQT